jgi:hypothetical protein
LLWANSRRELLWKDTSVVLAIAAITTTFLRDTGCSRSNARIHRRRLAVVLVANNSTPVRTISRRTPIRRLVVTAASFLSSRSGDCQPLTSTCESGR